MLFGEIFVAKLVNSLTVLRPLLGDEWDEFDTRLRRLKESMSAGEMPGPTAPLVQALRRLGSATQAGAVVQRLFSEAQTESSPPPKKPPDRGGETVIPLLAEEVAVSKQVVETGRTQVSRVTHEREQVIDELLAHETVEIDRTPIGRQVDTMPAVRDEGDTIVIPIVEEVLVIERRLLLKEEVRVRRVRSTERHQESVTLRHHDAVVTRLPAETPAAGEEPDASIKPQPAPSRTRGVDVEVLGDGRVIGMYTGFIGPPGSPGARAPSSPASTEVGATEPAQSTPAAEPNGAALSPRAAETQPRFLKGRMPQHVKLGDEVPLQVAIALTQGSGASAALRPFPVPAEGETVKLVLFCSGFDPVGPSVQDVVVPPNADSDWVLFFLRATGQGINEVEISAYVGSAYLGALRLEVAVNDAVPTGPLVERADVMTVRHPEEGEATLTIRYDEKAGIYRYSLRARELGETDEILSKALIDPPQQVVEKLVGLLNAQARNLTAFSDSEARRWLRGLGEYMWDSLIPRELQELFWQLDGRINRLNILSSGDPIPWEMLYPFRTDTAAARRDLGFMSERFVVSRWIFGPPPAEKVHLYQPHFVVPADAPPSARSEVDALRQKLKMGSEVGDLTRLLDLIDNGGFGLLHFASHNMQTNVITASYVPIGGKHFEVTFLSPALRNRYRKQAPLVFMNACRSAGLAANYTYLTGWASAFVRAGVGAFIGSLWEVRDDAALTYADAFYQALLDRKDLGEAMTEGRRAIERRGNGDPTWLAYTLYGDPNSIATLEQTVSADGRGP